MDVPPHSEATVVVPANVGPDAPWRRMTYGLTASLDDRRLALPEARIGGRSGVPLSIDVPGTSEFRCASTASPSNPAGFVVLRLPPAARRTLRRRGRVTVVIETVARGGPTASQRVTLRR